MPFKYYGGGYQNGMTGLEYPDYQQQNQQGQQQGGMDMGSMMGIGEQFMGGEEGGGMLGSLFGGGGGTATGSQAAGNLAASEGIGSAGTIGGGGWGASAGSAGGSGASSGGSAMSSAGPWAALAAIIVANEYNAKGGGYRSDDDFQYTQDVFSGEVLGQDMEKRWLPKLGLEEGSDENKWISHLIHPVSADLEESWSSFKDLF